MHRGGRKPTTETCATCHGPHYAKGLCQGCYARERYREGRDLNCRYPTLNPDTGRWTKCAKGTVIYGMCAAHARLIMGTAEALADAGFEKPPIGLPCDDVRFW